MPAVAPSASTAAPSAAPAPVPFSGVDYATGCGTGAGLAFLAWFAVYLVKRQLTRFGV